MVTHSIRHNSGHLFSALSSMPGKGWHYSSPGVYKRVCRQPCEPSIIDLLSELSFHHTTRLWFSLYLCSQWPNSCPMQIMFQLFMATMFNSHQFQKCYERWACHTAHRMGQQRKMKIHLIYGREQYETLDN